VPAFFPGVNSLTFCEVNYRQKRLSNRSVPFCDRKEIR
jgi:hypothetical protein